MVNYRSRIVNPVSSVIAVLFIIVHVAFAAEPISYDDFLQSLEDAIASEAPNDDLPKLFVSKLPQEILNLMKEELYVDKVEKNFETNSKEELTKILINDLKSRKEYYQKNWKAFESFISNVLNKDLDNYPAEDSNENPMEIMFLSKMTIEGVDKFMEKTIKDKKLTADDSWKVLTLKDAFRTIFFYCKYPKEMAQIFSAKMQYDVKYWLDSMPTWGVRGFDDDGEPSINIEDTQHIEL